MLKHVRPRKALQFECDLSLVREEPGDQMINEDQTIDPGQLHITLDLQIVEQEMEAPMTENDSCEEDDEDDGDSILTNPPTMLDEDDVASDLAFDRLFLGRRLAEMQEEEEEEIVEKAPRRGSVVEGRESLVAAWVETGGRRGFARTYRLVSVDTSGRQRCLAFF